MLKFLKKIKKKIQLKLFFINHLVIVIESDDWGYASFFNKKTYNFLKKYIKDFNSPYAYHLLESKEDLFILQNTFSKIKDSYNHPLQITTNFIVQQPDFESIIKANYQKLFFKNIDFNKYKDIINSKIFYPQFHGRHHFNIKNWLKDLRTNENNARELVNNYSFVIIDYNLKFYNGENAEVNYKINFHNEEYLKYLIRDGLKIFEQIFGFKSKSVIAPSYYKNEICEEIYKENGVEFIQGDCCSHLEKVNNNFINKKTYLGKINKNRLVSLCRNIIFEPSIVFFKSKDYQQFWFEFLKLKSVKELYKSNPLIICSHSYNYLGGLNPNMRNFSIDLLVKYMNFLKNMSVKNNKKILFLNSIQMGELYKYGKTIHNNIEINIDEELNFKNIFKIILFCLKIIGVNFKVIALKIQRKLK